MELRTTARNLRGSSAHRWAAYAIACAAAVGAAIPAAAAFALTTISASIPGGTYDATSTGIGAYVGNFYQFALWAGGILAFGIIVFGGVKYMISMGNPSNQEDAKEWIKAALLGVLLLAGAYFILNVVNPQLVNLSIPALTKINLPNTNIGTGTGVGGTGAGLTQDQAAQELAAAGISVTSSGNCSDPTNPACTSLQGMQQSTINELIALKNACGCSIDVTGGTEAGHAAGDMSHANGYKADINPTSAVSGYITSNYTQINNRSSDGAQQWQDPATGAIYARESNHWDITVP